MTQVNSDHPAFHLLLQISNLITKMQAGSKGAAYQFVEEHGISCTRTCAIALRSRVEWLVSTQQMIRMSWNEILATQVSCTDGLGKPVI